MECVLRKFSSCGHKGFKALLKSNGFDLPYEAELQTPPSECTDEGSSLIPKKANKKTMLGAGTTSA